MSIKIIQDLVPIGRKNRPGIANPCKYVTIHNTGNTTKGANAKSHASYVKSDAAANGYVSWHYTVDDSVVYRHIPDTETAYHAGDGSGPGNRQSLGIEICMNSDGDLKIATENAAELTAELCLKHNIPVENVVQHNRWSGKNCPQMLRSGKPFSWDMYIEKVKSYMEPIKEEEMTQEKFEAMYAAMIAKNRGDYSSEWAREATELAKEKGVFAGDGSGNFDWQEPMTREAVAVVLWRMGLL